ncbi:hypothetical protein [Phenylobacterium sp.]|uniref:hypothetical protein n=1 Tax=Phenylobacterium sp. TaxID=1871053 RepID=UPI002719F84A|nr:hypothetical protein [Phenylobacterium sp.]MDO8801400.1 hypothetical protein [Phenylobacterium sp.]
MAVSEGGHRLAAVVVALTAGLALLLGGAEAANAQSSTPRQARVPFGPPVGGDGYTGGSVALQYAFLNCFGELHIAYGLVAGSAQASDVYLMGGKTYEARGGTPQPSSIKLSGTAKRLGSEVIGPVADNAAGPALGLGCYTGQLIQLGVLTHWLGPKPTPQQVTNFLNTLTLDVAPGGPVRDFALEARLRSEDRGRQAAEAKRLADAKQAQAAKSAAPPPTRAPGGAAPQAQAPGPRAPGAPAQRPLSAAERGDRAIAADKVLEQQRRAQDQERLRQQMANAEAARQRQNEALAAAAPQIMELGGSLQAMSDNFMQRRFEEGQARLGNRCKLANGAQAPKDGDLRLGAPLRSAISTADCGDNVDDRYKAFRLDLREKTRVRFTLTNTRPLSLAKFFLLIQNMQNQEFMRISWDEWAPIQRTASKTVDLPAGAYIVRVHNAGFNNSFELRADALDAAGRMMTAAPAPAPAPAPAAAAAQLKSPAPGAATGGRLGGLLGGLAGRPAPPAAAQPGAGGAYLGLTVTFSKGVALIRTVDPAGPAALAGLKPGDQLGNLAVARMLGISSWMPDNQASLDAWLAREQPGAKVAVAYRRNGKSEGAFVFLGRTDQGPPSVREARPF